MTSLKQIHESRGFRTISASFIPAVSQKTQQCFDAAMKEGEVLLRNGSALLLGVGGSGKTHVLAAFLKEDPPSI